MYDSRLRNMKERRPYEIKMKLTFISIYTSILVFLVVNLWLLLPYSDDVFISLLHLALAAAAATVVERGERGS